MAQQVEYLKTENEILRKRQPKNLRTTEAERKRLIRVGAPLGTGLKHLGRIMGISGLAALPTCDKRTIIGML